MVKTALAAYALGVATLWPLLYFVAFLGFIVVMILTSMGGGHRDDGPRGWFVVLALLHVFTFLLILALIGTYLVDVFRNDRLREEQDDRAVWAVVIVLFGVFAMPVYWWLYLRPTGDAFRERIARIG